MEWFQISNISEVDSPALVVFPDRVQKNISVLKGILPDVNRLRPHVKTHKSSEVTKILLQSGFKKFKCATIAEAEMLGSVGALDVLLAYQPVGPKIHRLVELVKAFPRTMYSCLVDNIVVANDLNTAFSKFDYRLNVYIDLNIGMNRTGIKPSRDAERLYEKCQSTDGIFAIGLHAYDVHLRDEDLQIRTQKCNEGFEPVFTMQRNLKGAGMVDPFIVVGGTTTFPIHAKRKEVMCSPGTFIYWDKGYHDRFAEQHFEFAAIVIARVISKPSTDIICVDLGHKAIASENALTERVYFLNAPNLQPVGHSEEHLVIKIPDGKVYNVGDVLYGVPFHICPTVALHDSVVVVRDNKAIDRWNNLSRNRKITY